MPYIYRIAIAAHQKGHPMHRAMFVEFLEDPNTHHLDRQFMLGPSLLVSPVFVKTGEESEYYVPEGCWHALMSSGRTVRGPVWVKEVVPLEDIPVWVRPGSVLCLGPSDVEKPDYDLSRQLEVRLYEIPDGYDAATEVPSGKPGEISGSIQVRRVSKDIIITVPAGVNVARVGVFIDGLEMTGVQGGQQSEDDPHIFNVTQSEHGGTIKMTLVA